MFYQNGNYMQDLNYYNQNPNFGFNPYVQNNFQNQNMNSARTMQPNLIAMYPAIYRIIQPVVEQTLSNANTSYLTEESLNNLVDTVYNIVEGDVDLNKNLTALQSQQENQNPTGNSRNSSTTVNNMKNNQNTLLRDLIKIMILNEIILRNHKKQVMMNQNNMMPNPNFNSMMYM